MQTLIGGVMVVLIGVSWLAGPIAGVWLLVRGEWWALGVALVSMVVSHFLLAIALLPAMLLATPAAMTIEKRPRLGLALGLPAMLYTAALITVWCMGVFSYFMSRAGADNWFPLMLLSFSVATGPWSYMAGQESKDGGGEGALVSTFFMQLAYVIVMAWVALDRSVAAGTLWVTFALVMALQVITSMVIARIMDRERVRGWEPA